MLHSIEQPELLIQAVLVAHGAASCIFILQRIIRETWARQADKLREGFHGAGYRGVLGPAPDSACLFYLGSKFSFLYNIDWSRMKTHTRGRSVCLLEHYFLGGCLLLLSFASICPFVASVCFSTSYDDYDVCFFLFLCQAVAWLRRI